MKKQTNEKRLDIIRQPVELCPEIDFIIHNIELIHNYLELADYQHEFLLTDTIDYIDAARNTTEELREQVSLLRKWGQLWKDKALEFEELI